MELIKNPNRLEWARLMERPVERQPGVKKSVEQINRTVCEQGDEALFRYTKKFDRVALDTFEVSNGAIQLAEQQVDDALKAAIQRAKSNIETFHQSQLREELPVETTRGVTCWRKNVPIEKVGLYVPAGSAPLFSTVLMLGIPAQIADCNEVVLCTPPQANGQVDPTILFTANLVGIDKIYKIGGSQAIAAMAVGTSTVPAVNKIFGPGNSYVTEAKKIAQQQGVAIDMPAGPSELLVMADKSSNPAFVAADLLSQAEHGPDSQVVVVGDDESVLERIIAEIQKQLDSLPRKEIAEKALDNSLVISMNSLDMCMEFSNKYAPEHLIIACDESEKLSNQVINAGSVFLGHYSPESAGDYASGTNHTLPTNGFTKSYSGVSVDSFIKKITFQQITPEGLQQIGPTVEQMAAGEQLVAHKNAVSIRLEAID